MKIPALLSLLLFSGSACIGQELVRPKVAKEFGKPIVVTAEFVAKSNTYFDQNIVKEPFRLKVITVDGRKLKKEVLIEYQFDANEDEITKLERIGATVELEARNVAVLRTGGADDIARDNLDSQFDRLGLQVSEEAAIFDVIPDARLNVDLARGVTPAG